MAISLDGMVDSSMANRRMFSRDVVETDKFLGMPLTTQALYFHLGMEADDDGFVSSPKKVQRAVGCTEGDLKHLASCGYIIPFESGVVVIADWSVNNWIRPDRKHDTRFPELLKILNMKNGVYCLGGSCQPNDSQLTTVYHTEDRLGKVNIDKDNINTSEQTPENGTGIFIILGDGTFYDVPLDKLTMWQQAYPDLDVKRELYQMASWCDANLSKRKSRRGVEKFINGWLNRSQKDGQQNSKKEEVKNNAAEPEAEYNPEDDPEHVSSANEVWERLRREGRL